MSIGNEADFSQAILDEAQQEADGILNLARREAERILEGAHEELEKIYIAESPQAQQQQAATRYHQIVAAAELEARRTILQTQEQYIQQAQATVRERLQALRNEERYPEVLCALIRQGLNELEGDEFAVGVAPEDVPLVTDDMLTSLHEQTGKRATLADTPRDGITGAIITRADQRVVCDNSFQAIMDREQNAIRLLIATALFGDVEL